MKLKEKGSIRKISSASGDSVFLTIQPGENFNDLPETYVIFITENDVIGMGEPLYMIERRIVNIDKPLNDGSHIIYVNGAEKNAFCFLGQTVSWNGEFEKVKALKSKFFTLCKDKGLPRSILHRLMILNDLCQLGETKYLWHTAYFLKRFSEGKSDEIKELCNELKTKLTSPRQYQLTALAARWAELKLRNNNQ